MDGFSSFPYQIASCSGTEATGAQAPLNTDLPLGLSSQSVDFLLQNFPESEIALYLATFA